MSITPADLRRRFFLDVTADGAVFIRERGQPLARGSLPCFTTATYEEAEALQVRHCRLARDGSGIYRLNDWVNDDLDSIGKTTDMFRASSYVKRARKTG